MKKLLILVIFGAIFFTSSIFSAQAAYDFSKNTNTIGTKLGYDAGSVNSPEYYVGLILSIIFSVLGLVFLILTMYAGIKWMTAQGNNSQIESAKDTLTRAIIGLVICLVSYGITFFVVNIFQGNNQKYIDTPVNSSDINAG
jgi:cytochrome bd-type quinol oxidase subunit 2